MRFFAFAVLAFACVMTATSQIKSQVPLKSPIHVNQHAYLPSFSKQATYRPPQWADNIKEPRKWALTSGGRVVAKGTTRYFGLDKGSNDRVHIIDFTHVDSSGTYHLEVTEGEQTLRSYSFRIDANALAKLKYDALAYFYHNRSGQPIVEQYVEEKWHARPVGHADTRVETAPCFESADHPNCRIIDVSGGWYDAGDHGKYVVNAGISVWTLLNLYERSKHWGANLPDFADGTMSIPEQSNGLPDLLDEVRYELDWLFKMQVPNNEQNAGMVHHKVHSEEWTSLPIRPDRDTLRRIVQPVSTAATLNFAAVMAQCARVYKNVDESFAQSCEEKAHIAYAAAKATPDIYPLKDTPGAGNYGDNNLGDEFYWAATELYISTLDETYLKDIQSSSYHMAFRGDEQTGASSTKDKAMPDSVMGWPLTHMLGTFSLATAGSAAGAEAELIRQAQELTVRAADAFVEVSKAQGYGQPYDGTAVVWGSNSDIVNNMLVLGLANDFRCGDDATYLDTLQSGLSYLMGRNPLSQSYVTGYGHRPLLAPHHRFWANALDTDYPTAPPGALSGGPNKGIQDPVAQEQIKGCPPTKCFVDHIESWSTNEITINWNAPFAWAVAYLDEQANPQRRAKTLKQCSI